MELKLSRLPKKIEWWIPLQIFVFSFPFCQRLVLYVNYFLQNQPRFLYIHASFISNKQYVFSGGNKNCIIPINMFISYLCDYVNKENNNCTITKESIFQVCWWAYYKYITLSQRCCHLICVYYIFCLKLTIRSSQILTSILFISKCFLLLENDERERNLSLGKVNKKNLEWWTREKLQGSICHHTVCICRRTALAVDAYVKRDDGESSCFLRPNNQQPLQKTLRQLTLLPHPTFWLSACKCDKENCSIQQVTLLP